MIIINLMQWLRQKREIVAIVVVHIETKETVWEVPEDGDVVVEEHQLQTNPMKRKPFKKIEDAEHGV